jgi:hypothetical protein
LRELQEWFETRVADGDDARRMTDQHQLELDSLKATLRQVEQHNEKMKSDIAVTRRATYAAEETVAQLEKDKQDQARSSYLHWFPYDPVRVVNADP